jgi:hypothetical protein
VIVASATPGKSHRRGTIAGDHHADDRCVDGPDGLRERRFGAIRSRRPAWLVR